MHSHTNPYQPSMQENTCNNTGNAILSVLKD